MATKNVLFLLRRPADAAEAAEALDAALVAAVFDQSVSLLFKDEGVSQIETQSVLAETIGSLADYDINAVYACEESLAVRNIGATDLLRPVTSLDAGEQARLIDQQDVVVND